MHNQHNSNRAIDRLSDYSDESLVKELQRIAKVVGKTALTLKDIETHGKCSYALLKKRFGGLRNALKAADLENMEFHRNVSDDELLNELSRIWDLVITHEGRRPYKDDLIKYKSKFSQGPYYRRWGSWIKACEALIDWEPKDIIQDHDEVVELSESAPKYKRPIPLRIRYAILLRDRFTCQICGKSPSSNSGLEIDVDHIISEHDGGTLDPSNLRCLCKPCNIGKGRHSERVRDA